MSALERLAKMAGDVVEVACEEKNTCRDQFPDEYFLWRKDIVVNDSLQDTSCEGKNIIGCSYLQERNI